MSYRDDGAKAAGEEQLVVQRDEALARVGKLEGELAETRTWLQHRKEERPPLALRAMTAASWGGYGCLGGSLAGLLVGVGLENPILIPLGTILGGFAAAIMALGARNKDDGFPGAPSGPY